MHKPGIVCVPMLLALGACVHDGGGSRAAPPAQTPAAPATPTPSTAASTPPPAPSAIPRALPAEPQITAEPVPPRSAAPPPGSRSGAPAARAVPPASPTSAAHAAPAVTPAAAAAPVASAPALDLNALEQRLRDTRAIGVFTKLSLKNQVDDLLTQFKAFYGGQSRFTLVQLRQNFEVLLMKVVSVLQEGDPALATAVSASREAIWGVLKDPKKFAAI